MLTELNREAPVAPAAAAADARSPRRGAGPGRGAPVDAGPAPMVARDHADTAMLLRELSSLGFGRRRARRRDRRPRAAPPRRGRRAADPKKKRKGLFGRG